MSYSSSKLPLYTIQTHLNTAFLNKMAPTCHDQLTQTSLGFPDMTASQAELASFSSQPVSLPSQTYGLCGAGAINITPYPSVEPLGFQTPSLPFVPLPIDLLRSIQTLLSPPSFHLRSEIWLNSSEARREAAFSL